MGVVERDSTTARLRGVVFISKQGKLSSKIIDIIIENDNGYTHKQVEKRNGLLFMRMKKRSLTPVHA